MKPLKADEIIEYAQARKDGFIPPEYADEQLPASSFGSPQWRTSCRLPREAPGQLFPDVNEPRPQDSIFQNKKASRRHAARCAIEWLIAQGLMSSNGFYIAPVSNSSKVETVSITVAQSPPRLLQSTIISPAEASKPTASHQPSQSSTSFNGSIAAERVNIQQQQQQKQQQQQQQWPTPAAPSSRIQSMASWAGGANTKASSWNLAMAAADNGTSATNVLGGVNGSDGSTTGRSNTTGVSERLSHFRSDGNDYEVSNTHLLDSLCKVLKLGSPTYELVPNREGTEGIFSGHIVFTPPSAKGGGSGTAPVLPEGVGEVHDVFTKKAAREKIAQSVLQYLKKNMLGSDGVV